MIKTAAHKDLEPVLLDPKGIGVKEPYFVFQGENEENISVVSSGKNGAEFNKTFGVYHTYPGVIALHCVYGQGVVLIQRNDQEGSLKEVKVAGIRAGSAIEIPSGWGYCLVNTGKNLLIAVDNAPSNPKFFHDDDLKEKKGFAYYIIDKKGNIAFEENPNYPFHPQISTY